VAVVGAGISGLTAAYLLARTHNVILFVADKRLGGHAHTHDVVDSDGQQLSVDSAFIVHNDLTYPWLRKLFGELDVEVRPTEMSMSVRCEGCGLEYAGGRRVRRWRGGVPGVLLGSPRDDAGNLIMLGTGQQHWSTVHAADLADFFRRVLENDSARGYYVIGNGANSTVAELTEAAAVAVGAPGAVAGSDEEARTRLGDYFAEVLLLDQSTTAAKARTELDWYPSHPGLVDEFRHGSYRN